MENSRSIVIHNSDPKIYQMIHVLVYPINNMCENPTSSLHTSKKTALRHKMRNGSPSIYVNVMPEEEGRLNADRHTHGSGYLPTLWLNFLAA